jgi:hypothetical protein
MNWMYEIGYVNALNLMYRTPSMVLAYDAHFMIRVQKNEQAQS